MGFWWFDLPAQIVGRREADRKLEGEITKRVKRPTGRGRKGSRLPKPRQGLPTEHRWGGRRPFPDPPHLVRGSEVPAQEGLQGLKPTPYSVPWPPAQGAVASSGNGESSGSWPGVKCSEPVILAFLVWHMLHWVCAAKTPRLGVHLCQIPQEQWETIITPWPWSVERPLCTMYLLLQMEPKVKKTWGHVQLCITLEHLWTLRLCLTQAFGYKQHLIKAAERKQCRCVRELCAAPPYAPSSPILLWRVCAELYGGLWCFVTYTLTLSDLNHPKS